MQRLDLSPHFRQPPLFLLQLGRERSFINRNASGMRCCAARLC
jgi:hypothetical protein